MYPFNQAYVGEWTVGTLNLRARVKQVNTKVVSRLFTADSASDKENILLLAQAQVKPGERLYEVDLTISAGRTPTIWACYQDGEDPNEWRPRWLLKHEEYLQMARERAQ